jgi:hypothetical protein
MEDHMQYKTIVLEILKHRPQMHNRLRKDRTLLPTMEQYARELKDSHLAWMELLSRLRPGSDPRQISSEALETALKELQLRLPADAPRNAGETVFLDARMLFTRRRSRCG